MAATITWIGTNGAGSDGVISLADSLTGWTAFKITAGGPAPTAAVADTVIEGTGAVTCTSNNKRVFLSYDIGVGNTLDFTGSGNAENQMVYIWGNFLAAGLLQVRNTGGLGIFMDSTAPSSTQYNLWYFFGKDNYSGGWKRMVVDPTETPSASAGTTINLAAIRYFGVFGDTLAAARFDNLICDQMMVGKGLTVTGTSTSEAVIADLIADETTNRYGIVTALNDTATAVALNGQLVLGDITDATNSTLSDIDSKIFVEEPLYYDGTEVTSTVPLSYFTITAVGGTGTNSIIIGKAVGADAGRSGWTLVGNDTYDVSIDFDNGSVNTSEWYGCLFENLSGTLAFGTDTAHKMFSSSFSRCEQFDPVGGVQLRNLAIINTVSTTGGLLWNGSIDIALSNFLANTTGEGIEHTSLNSVHTGTATNSGSETTTLFDTGFTSGVSVNDYILNETDDSFAKVTTVVSNTEITHEALQGGINDFWTTSDAYSISVPETYSNLLFSGNTADVTNSASGSDGLFVLKGGVSDPITKTGAIEFIGAVTMTFEAVDGTDTAVVGAQISAYKVSDNSEVFPPTDTNGSGISSGSFTGSTPLDIYYRYRKSSTGSQKYFNISGFATIVSETGVTVKRTMVEDTISDPSI